MISVNIIIDNPEWKKKNLKIINYIKKKYQTSIEEAYTKKKTLIFNFTYRQ